MREVALQACSYPHPSETRSSQALSPMGGIPSGKPRQSHQESPSFLAPHPPLFLLHTVKELLVSWPKSLAPGHHLGPQEAGVTDPSGQGTSRWLSVHMPVTPTHSQGVASPIRNTGWGGQAREFTARPGQAGAATGSLPGCHCRSITSGGFHVLL